MTSSTNLSACVEKDKVIRLSWISLHITSLGKSKARLVKTLPSHRAQYKHQEHPHWEEGPFMETPFSLFEKSRHSRKVLHSKVLSWFRYVFPACWSTSSLSLRPQFSENGKISRLPYSGNFLGTANDLEPHCAIAGFKILRPHNEFLDRFVTVTTIR